MAERYFNESLKLINAHVRGEPERCRGAELITQTIATKVHKNGDTPATKGSSRSLGERISIVSLV